MARKYSTVLHYLLIEVIKGQPPIRVPVRARRATKSVRLPRTMMDVMKGKQGFSITCANAQCALANQDLFDHPVIMAEFTDRRAYIVDKLDDRGAPYSCVVYDHDQGEFQKKFDQKSKGLISRMSGVEKTFSLYPPARYLAGEGRKDAKHGGSSGPSGPTSRKKPGTHRKNVIRGKGALARLERAGINVAVSGK